MSVICGKNNAEENEKIGLGGGDGAFTTHYFSSPLLPLNAFGHNTRLPEVPDSLPGHVGDPPPVSIGVARSSRQVGVSLLTRSLLRQRFLRHSVASHSGRVLLGSCSPASSTLLLTSSLGSQFAITQTKLPAETFNQTGIWSVKSKTVS